LSEPVLALPRLADWVIFTHEGAASGWDEGHVIPTYRLKYRTDSGTDTLEALRTATHVYWSSGSQFEALREAATAARHHSCGPGKTAEVLEAAGLAPVVFPSAEVWRRWIRA